MDADLLPSYEQATLRDPVASLADYLPPAALKNSTAVCRKWNRLLAPSLWYHVNLSVHAISELSLLGDSTKSLVRVVTIANVEHSDYETPESHWLLDLFRQLPNVNALLCRGVAALDHDSLRAAATSDHLHALKILSFAASPNVTASALTSFLARVPNLTYIDLSNSPAAKDASILSICLRLPITFMRVNEAGLNGHRLRSFVHALSKRLTYLDLSQNMVTDADVKYFEAENLRFDLIEPTIAYRHDADFLRSLRIADGKAAYMLQFRPSRGQKLPSLHYLSIRDNCLSYSGMLTLIRQCGWLAMDVGCPSLCTGVLESHTPEASTMSPSLLYLRCPFAVLIPTPERGENVHTNPTALFNQRDDGAQIQARPAQDQSHIKIQEQKRIKHLVLTGIPSSTTDRFLIDSLIQLINVCAAETRQALSFAQNDYTLAPGTHRSASKMRDASKAWFGLEQITLEIAEQGSARTSSFPSRMNPGVGRSVTEDADSERLWEAAQSDFTFFGIADPGNPSCAAMKSKDQGNEIRHPSLNVVEELAAFRLSTRGKEGSKVVSSDEKSAKDGHWHGVIAIVRSP